MTLDLSLEAIEADLQRAEASGVPNVVAVLLARAQVRATLLAAGMAVPRRYVLGPDGDLEDANLDALAASAAQAQPITMPPPATVTPGPDINVAQAPGYSVFTVPDGASWQDRVEAAAMLLGVEKALLMLRLHDADGTWEDRVEAAAMLLGTDKETLAARLGPPPVEELVRAMKAEEPPLEAPAEVDEDEDVDDEDQGLDVDPGFDDTFAPVSGPEDDDIDADFFAEARAEHRGRGKK